MLIRLLFRCYACNPTRCNLHSNNNIIFLCSVYQISSISPNLGPLSNESVRTTICRLMMVVWPKHVVAIRSEEEKMNCCGDGSIIAQFFPMKFLPNVQPVSPRTSPCRLCATAQSIHSQIPSIPGDHIFHPKPEDSPLTGEPFNMAGNIANLIWGVCILLSVWYHMIWVLIRLRNVNIVG
jgi:hypothetical protein